MVMAVMTTHDLSQRRACGLIGITRRALRRGPAEDRNRELRTREYLELMIELWSKSDPSYKGRTVSTAGMKFMPKTVQQPHPPIVFGGTSEPALKRTVRQGDGWYGIAHGLEEAQAQIAKLREFARAAGRTRPIEITMSLRTGKPLSADDVRRMAEMGVDRTLAGLPIRALEGADLERFRAQIMDKV